MSRASVPGAVIDWVVEEPFAEVAALHASVRRVIPVALRRWRGALLSPATWSEIGRVPRRAAQRALRRGDRQPGPDQERAHRARLRAAAGTASTGRARANRSRRASTMPVHAVPANLHAVERNRRLAGAALGYRAEGPLRLRLARRRRSAAAGGACAAPYALLLTMTSRDDKLWPEEHWRALGAWLERRACTACCPGERTRSGAAARASRRRSRAPSCRSA